MSLVPFEMLVCGCCGGHLDNTDDIAAGMCVPCQLGDHPSSCQAFEADDGRDYCPECYADITDDLDDYCSSCGERV